MIESLFPRDWRRYVEGPRGILVREFANWIIEQRYTRHCAKCHIRRFRAMLIESRGAIKPARPISSEKLARCFEDDPEYRGTKRAAERFFASNNLLISRQRSKPSASILAAYRSESVKGPGASSFG